MRRIVWAGVTLCSIVATLEAAVGLMSADSAPQQAAAAAMSMVWVVIPYVFARSLDGILAPTSEPKS